MQNTKLNKYSEYHKYSKYKLLLSFCAILLLSTCQTFAQFTLDKTSGCAPLTVTAINTSGIPSVLYDFGQGAGLKPEAISQPYTKAGTYTIQQLVGGFMGTKTQTITVYDNETPKFVVEFCGDNIVNVKILSNGMPQYVIDYGDGTAQSTVTGLTSTTHQYTNTMPKTITVSGFIAGSTTCGTATQTITPLSRVSSALFKQVKVLSNGNIELTFEQNAENSYKLEELNETTSLKKLIDLAPSATSLVLTNRNLDIDSYIYRINPFDKCKNSTTQATEAIGTVNLQVTAQAQQNLLSWDIPLYFGFVSYEIYRDNVLLTTLTSLNTTNYADKKITCNKTYIYRLELVLHGGKSRSISINRSVTAIASSVPKVVQSPIVSTQNSQIDLIWKYAAGDTAKTIIISKTVDGVVENDIVLSGNLTKYLDNNVKPNEKLYCYNITYLDLCGNKSPKSAAVCNVLLKGTEDPQNVLLSWQGSFPSGSQVFLEKIIDKDITVIPVNGMSYSDLKSAFTSPNVSYRLRIVNPEGVSYSNIFAVRLPSEFEIPNAFSPNGDGLNDVFRPTTSKFLTNYKMTIFSQWGTVVFESVNAETGWDGSGLSGTFAPSGVYAFQIDYYDSIGRPTVKQGIVTLIR